MCEYKVNDIVGRKVIITVAVGSNAAKLAIVIVIAIMLAPPDCVCVWRNIFQFQIQHLLMIDKLSLLHSFASTKLARKP